MSPKRDARALMCLLPAQSPFQQYDRPITCSPWCDWPAAVGLACIHQQSALAWPPFAAALAKSLLAHKPSSSSGATKCVIHWGQEGPCTRSRTHLLPLLVLMSMCQQLCTWLRLLQHRDDIRWHASAPAMLQQQQDGPLPCLLCVLIVHVWCCPVCAIR